MFHHGCELAAYAAKKIRFFEKLLRLQLLYFEMRLNNMLNEE